MHNVWASVCSSDVLKILANLSLNVLINYFVIKKQRVFEILTKSYIIFKKYERGEIAKEQIHKTIKTKNKKRKGKILIR